MCQLIKDNQWIGTKLNVIDREPPTNGLKLWTTINSKRGGNLST